MLALYLLAVVSSVQVTLMVSGCILGIRYTTNSTDGSKCAFELRQFPVDIMWGGCQHVQCGVQSMQHLHHLLLPVS